MTRVAEAAARAGHKGPAEDRLLWQRERHAASEFFGATTAMEPAPDLERRLDPPQKAEPLLENVPAPPSRPPAFRPAPLQHQPDLHPPPFHRPEPYSPPARAHQPSRPQATHPPAPQVAQRAGTVPAPASRPAPALPHPELHPAPALHRPELHSASARANQPSQPQPTPPPALQAAPRAEDLLNPIDFELSALVRRVFLVFGRTTARSVLFCGSRGGPTGDVAWRAAELLAMQSGRRVGFVEDGSLSTRRRTSITDHSLVARIGWYPASAQQSEPARAIETNERPPVSHALQRSNAGSAQSRRPVHTANESDLIGERVSDLLTAFDFVIVSAAAADPGELVPLAQEVDAVMLILSERGTRRDAARALVSALRSAKANLLGAVLTSFD